MREFSRDMASALPAGAATRGSAVFFFRRNRTPLIRGKTGGEQFLRFMALIAVFAGAGWLFWLNNERSMERIQSRGAVVDLGDQLSPRQKQILRDFAVLFRDEFGLVLKVHVGAKHLEPPAPDNKTLFIGVNPVAREVRIQAPPLVANALGPELLHELETGHFGPFFELEQWPQGLLAAVERIWTALADLRPPMPRESSPEKRFPIAPAQGDGSG